MLGSKTSSRQVPSGNHTHKTNVQAMSRRSRLSRGIPYALRPHAIRANFIRKASVIHDVASSGYFCDIESHNSDLSSVGEMRLPVNFGKPRVPIVAVIGTGYVGFQLVMTFGEKYRTIAFDICEDRIREVASQVKRHPNITCSTDPTQLTNATHFLVAVPTGLSDNGNEINVSSLHAALDTIARNAQKGATVVIESSVAVGMTRRLLGPLLATKALKGGMSPERVDPGRTNPPHHSIPKIISGLDDIAPGSLESIESLYGNIFTNLVKVSAPEVAEMDVNRLDESKEWVKERLEEFDIIIVANKQESLDFLLLDDLENVRVVMCCA